MRAISWNSITSINKIESVITDYINEYSLEELLEEFGIDPVEAFMYLLEDDFISDEEFQDWLMEDNPLDIEENFDDEWRSYGDRRCRAF